jgi:type II secretory pathway pseudopilin PulG
MAREISSSGFGRADALIAVAVCLFLAALVPPLFSQSQSRVEQILCRSNLAKIGRAMLTYARDYDRALPKAGGPTTQWGKTPNWMTPDRYMAFNLSRLDGSGGRASVSASLYLLVKYMKLPTQVFVCRADDGTTKLELSELSFAVPSTFGLPDAWDFGPATESWRHNSYAYHIPYDPCALTLDRQPGFAVAADRNPWIESPAAEPADFGVFRPDIPPWNGSAEQALAGNSMTHGSGGQNVLFLDGRVVFQTRAHCGIGKDNIYTLGTDPSDASPLGGVPVASPTLQAAHEADSVLVHDPDVFPAPAAEPGGR